MAEWSCSGLQSRGRRFDSDPRLQLSRCFGFARVVKLVDTGDLKSPGESHAGSSPAPGTSRATALQSRRIPSRMLFLPKM